LSDTAPIPQSPAPARTADAPTPLDRPRGSGNGDLARFAPAELAIVCSHYDLGVIRAIRPFPRGSSRSPKVILRTTTGDFLLKRRAPGRDNPYRVAFTHALQLHLARRSYPVARLIGTRGDNNSMLQLGGRIYELFEYVQGRRYEPTPGATGDAGRALAWLHRLVGAGIGEPGGGNRGGWEPPRGTYHDAQGIDRALASIPDRTGGANIREVVERLATVYRAASDAAARLGLAQWPEQIIHADWHPGNLLYQPGGDRVAAVLDFDSARLAPRVIDVANGALQFSMRMDGEDPTRWPDEPDQDRFRRFLTRYDGVEGCVISTAELEAIPHLMVEALIAEAVFPIAESGRFAHLDGPPLLRKVLSKADWIAGHTGELSAAAG
jgi:Ser/Thr protein kinase RdoA (MazF antagonist)